MKYRFKGHCAPLEPTLINNSRQTNSDGGSVLFKYSLEKKMDYSSGNDIISDHRLFFRAI